MGRLALSRRETILAEGWGEDFRSSASGRLKKSVTNVVVFVEVASEAYVSKEHAIFSRKVRALASLWPLYKQAGA